MGKRERARARKLKANALADRRKKQGGGIAKHPAARSSSSSSKNKSSTTTTTSSPPPPRSAPHSPRDAVRYAASQRILVVGDGDLSFSLGLVAHIGGDGTKLIATTYDSEAELQSKYSGRALANRERIVAAGSRVVHGVDATKLHHHRLFYRHSSNGREKEKEALFDRIVFNFPHSGQQRVHVNRRLLLEFFQSASQCVKAKSDGGQVHVTIKMAPPYSLWGIESLAAQAELAHVATLAFDQRLFPGYRHQTTLADAKTFVAASKAQARLCKTLVFAINAPSS